MGRETVLFFTPFCDFIQMTHFLLLHMTHEKLIRFLNVEMKLFVGGQSEGRQHNDKLCTAVTAQ